MANELEPVPEKTPEEIFQEVSEMVRKQAERFLKLVHPGCFIDGEESLKDCLERESSLLLDSMTFFRITRCTVENSENLSESVSFMFEKLFAALYSIGIPVGYGIISRDGVTNLVLCIYWSKDVEVVKKIIYGLLSGIELEVFKPGFQEKASSDKCESSDKSYGILSGVPSVFLKEQRQTFSPSSIMRALNGHNYTVLFLAKPVAAAIVETQIADLVDIKDKAFAVSKRNVAVNAGRSETITHVDGKNASYSDSVSKTFNLGLFSYSRVATTVGGTMSSDAKSVMETNGKTISSDIQNGFALQLVNYAEKAIERLKGGQNNGVWQTAICYSADSDLAKDIIKACLYSELSKPDPGKLPLLAFEQKISEGEKPALLIPNFLDVKDGKQNPLCSYINSSELGMLCTVPVDSVPDFELRTAKRFPLLKSLGKPKDFVKVGNVTDGKRSLENMPFGFTTADLSKHTFVCGITGSGKTTTVKTILVAAQTPFMVIEPAKKEYRNIQVDPTGEGKSPIAVYTLGRPEVNCPQINPFYIMPGVSPQLHIDYLKDLFIASFSFYGPMPYILEKCLHNVYIHKGWDLTLGYHPLLMNTKSSADFFDSTYMRARYEKSTHRYLFPTMQDLKDEIERYVEEEMNYGGEVAGNIKTAIKVRLESLCVGSKGYMFNTYEYLSMDELLKSKTVFELEGLADDSDKAFCVGLMVVFINEYRQTAKEAQGHKEMALCHLLVIEEAHRLLKNMDTGRSSENMGNPKGKAVEHFTNMIAEMRSYGQGVIVAEQIPSKLAPDVIKNSSNKIIQRIVSMDDQQIIANTIGISADDAIQLGTLETGYAFCHKEGMALPVSVKIGWVGDVFVNDGGLVDQGMMAKVDLSIARGVVCCDKRAKQIMLSLLNSILAEDVDVVVCAAEVVMTYFEGMLRRSGVEPMIGAEGRKTLATVVSDGLLSFMTHGVYAVGELPDNKFSECLFDFLCSPRPENVCDLKKRLEGVYRECIDKYSKRIVAELIKREKTGSTDLKASIRKYFAEVSEQTVGEIEDLIRGA